MLLTLSARNQSSFTVTFKRCKSKFTLNSLLHPEQLSKNISTLKSDCFCSFLDDGNDRPKPREGRPPLPVPEQYRCLVRAQSKSKKLSTIVNQSDVPKIMEGYAKLMKASMDGLKKVKKIKNKAKATG